MKASTKFVLLKLIATANLLLHVSGVILYCLQFVPFYEKPFGVINALNLLFGVFHINGAYYRVISGSALALAYFIILIILIKNLIASFNYFTRFVLKDSKNREDIFRDIRVAGSSFLAMAVFTLLVSWVKTYTFGFSVYFVWAGIAFGLIFSSLEGLLFHDYTWKICLIQLGYTAIFLFAFFMLFDAFQISSVRTCIFSFLSAVNASGKEVLLSAIAQLLHALIYIVLGILLLTVLNDYYTFRSLQNKRSQKKTIDMLYIGAIIFVVSIVMYLIKGNEVNAEQLWLICKPELPVYLGIIGLSFIPFFADFSKHRSKKKKKKNGN